MPDTPHIRGPDPMQVHRQGLAQGRFLIQQCKDCGLYTFPPSVPCTNCGSTDLKWVEPTGRARVHAFPALDAQSESGGSPGGAQILAMVELEEGPRMLAPVLGLAPGKVSIGMHVSAHIGMIDGMHTVVFYGLEQGSNEW